jgi:dimethylglycine dehydrogenase
MKTSAQVVVIGGGVIGASILYHLTKNGWHDVVLVERRELTAGSTWHSAGGMHTLNGDPNVAALQKYTIELYREIQDVSGQDCGLHLTGGLMLADTEERLDWLKLAHSRNRYLGLDTEIISVAEAKQILPYLDEQYFVGAMYDPMEGHVDPSGVTHAYAKAARMAGAEVYRNNWAMDIAQRKDGTWDVVCEQGTINAEHIVNCGGLWAREVGRMCGIELPILAMEHMYLLTEEVPGLLEWNRESGREGLHCMDFGGEIYMRQEGNGLLLGTYERRGVPWSEKHTSWEFGAQLLAPDPDRIAESLEVGFAHFPIFNEVGIKQIINGPFTFAPDGNPVIGPVKAQRGHWLAVGVMAGLSQGGGVGKTLANWITDGDPGADVWGMDCARFGDFATPAYTNAKVRENYSRRFRIAYPNEELPAARKIRTSPIHDRLDAANAVWGVSYGLEHALWFQRPGHPAEEAVTLRRSNAWDLVGEECAAVRTGVGLIETTNFAKYEFAGPGARGFLDWLLTNTIPAPGRMVLTPMLNRQGRLIGDFTLANLTPNGDADAYHGRAATGRSTGMPLGSERFMLFGSGVAEHYHERWFLDRLHDWHESRGWSDPSRDVRMDVLGRSLCGLSIAGPRSREVLAELVDDDVSNEAFRFLDIREAWVDMAPAIIGRVTYTGDLGFEVWMDAELQPYVFDRLMEAGAPYGIRLFGARALDSLRLEKNFAAWATEYRPIYTPHSAGLGWCVKVDKGEFVGRDAVVAATLVPPPHELSFFAVDVGDGDDAADVIGDEPIWLTTPDGSEHVVGWVTSGGYAHHSRTSVAVGYVRREHVDRDGDVEIEILGIRRPARRLRQPLLDPSGSRMRS